MYLSGTWQKHGSWLQTESFVFELDATLTKDKIAAQNTAGQTNSADAIAIYEI